MSKSYATILQNLCHDHMNHRLSFEEYRRKRRVLFSKIDEQFNGYSNDCQEDLTAPTLPSKQFGVPSFAVPAQAKKN
ncbi:hypothetical protein [Agarilytica rhodophyticola]|uniref:hypothetical protein n=1 Tax=Agarilytica rhodophyticola TaxID=1737490 RepID=UPI000B342760|nr:hypothetical protein [Agarilytica rhodophyticola]